MKSRTGYNPKRRLAAPADLGGVDLGALADACTYTGNAEHESDPGDFGLAPPYGPREGKTLCDAAGITRKADATRLLREGIRKGIVSRQRRGAWPQNVWAVLDDTPLEGQLENEAVGHYHGYPMPDADDFRHVVLKAWKARTP